MFNFYTYTFKKKMFFLDKRTFKNWWQKLEKCYFEFNEKNFLNNYCKRLQLVRKEEQQNFFRIKPLLSSN